MKAFLKFLKHLFERIFGTHSNSFDCKLDSNGDGTPEIEIHLGVSHNENKFNDKED